MAEPGAREVATDPRWLPHSYDLSGSMLTFVLVPRERHSDLTFLSDEHFKGEFAKATHPASAIAASVPDAAQAPLHFIFHTAFCGSTLMLKALEAPGRTFGLKEPDVLINLANRFIRSDDPANRERLRLVLKLLARPFEPGETMIVKPTNFANRLILPALECRPESRAVLLYSDVRTLLVSLLKRGMWGRIWGRRLLWSAGSWTSLKLGYDAEQTFVLTDMQALALAWLMQMRHFAEVAQKMGDRVMLVDSADFLEDPRRTLAAITQLFSLGFEAQEIEALATGPAFARHSKFSDRSYGNAERAADQHAAESAHREELEMVVKWIESVAAHLGVDLNPAAKRLESAL